MDNLAYKLGSRAVSNRFRTNQNDKVRVCFYGRVSTQHEAQINALDNQLQWYESVLKDHPNWEKVKVYVDKGISGTQATKRHGFMQMIEDASKGMFDLVCTREVSRFARNTLDSLDYTRRLKNMGVEVFFYNDNIWSCESDGELRLTIMSAMSQEESKHISDRVLAGHKTSREKGVLFGNGNILGYRLVKGKTSVENTYEIIEEEAETVRLIYDLYLSGIGMKAIASKMIEMHRKKANGGYNWEISAVHRILNNKTYAGYIGYNKSYTASFLEHRRVHILDRSQYEYVKGNFPPIVSEDTWNRVQALKAKKTICTGEQTRGKPMATDKWGKTLVCECGSTYKKYTWRVNKNGEESNGYQCRNQVVNRKRSFHVKNGLDGTGRCDVPSICEWKLDFMAKAIFRRLWKNQKDSISELMGTIEEYYTVDKAEDSELYEVEKLQRELDRLQKRKNNLVDMRLDDLIDETQYQKKYNLITERIKEVEISLQKLQCDGKEIEPVDVSAEIKKIQEYLDKACNLEEKQVSEELIEALVERITPTEEGVFKWYLRDENYDIAMEFQEEQYVLMDRFTLGFEEARAYRKSFGNFIRARQWKDLVVEVYIKKL